MHGFLVGWFGLAFFVVLRGVCLYFLVSQIKLAELVALREGLIEETKSHTLI